MTYLIDTTLLIDHASGMPSAVETFARLFEEGDDLVVCDVIVCEALSGGSEEQRAIVGRLLDALEYVSTDPGSARWAAESRRTRGVSSRRTLGDALVAGIARTMQATIVTRNPDDFVRQGVPVLTY